MSIAIKLDNERIQAEIEVELPYLYEKKAETIRLAKCGNEKARKEVSKINKQIEIRMMVWLSIQDMKEIRSVKYA